MGNKASEGELRYSIKKTEANRLGEGSYAEVFKIKSKDNKNLYAAKFFKLSLKDMDDLQKKGYESELDILQNLNHPFVIKYQEEFIYKGKQLCIVT